MVWGSALKLEIVSRCMYIWIMTFLCVLNPCFVFFPIIQLGISCKCEILNFNLPQGEDTYLGESRWIQVLQKFTQYIAGDLERYSWISFYVYFSCELWIKVVISYRKKYWFNKEQKWSKKCQFYFQMKLLKILMTLQSLKNIILSNRIGVS